MEQVTEAHNGRDGSMTAPAITYAQLKANDACKGQLALFKRKFDDSVVVTVELAESVADLFDWDWAARYLLDAPAWAEYIRATAPARAEYERAKADAWVEYKRATADPRAEYERADAATWAEYERVDAAARAEYKRATAAAFARAYIMEVK